MRLKKNFVININIIRFKNVKSNNNFIFLIFKNILYILENDFNLIFIKVLYKNGYLIKFVLNNIKIERYEIKVIW